MIRSLGNPVAHKALSANDLGITGSHQAGMHVPKSLARSGFFPALDETLLNPSESLSIELPTGNVVLVRFVYYNNRRFGGTRDEFRLTHLTRPLRELGAYPGGMLQITHLRDHFYRFDMLAGKGTAIPSGVAERPVLRLSGGWVLINLKGR